VVLPLPGIRLNAPPRGGNPWAVAIRTAPRALPVGAAGGPKPRLAARALVAVAGLALFSGGCAGRRGPLGPGEPGTTTILVENRLSSTDQLDRLLVTVDDAVVPLSALPPRDEETALTALRLPPGSHTISVRATAAGAEGDRVVVSAAQIFHIATAPAAIGIAVRSRPAGRARDDDGRIAVDLRMTGGQMDPEMGAPRPETADERCAPLLPVPRALCRAAGDMDEATRRNDLVSVLCVRDKLRDMRTAAQIAETSRGEGASLAEKQVLALSREVERCRRTDVMIGADGLTVTKISR
jgi:hypothetical protein